MLVVGTNHRRPDALNVVWKARCDGRRAKRFADVAGMPHPSAGGPIMARVKSNADVGRRMIRVADVLQWTSDICGAAPRLRGD